MADSAPTAEPPAAGGFPPLKGKDAEGAIPLPGPEDDEGPATAAAGGAGAGAAGAGEGGEQKKEGIHKDHPFFSYYGMLVHQQNMLQDGIRTGTYRSAILSNPDSFRGKVVVDVGTGSGILAFFAAQAGAKKVYAIEASDMAEHARKLVAGNKMAGVIEVIKGKVEEVELPEQADVIVSEPMGFLLVHERMLESYMIARQRFLKPGGLMMPSTGTIFCAPFTDEALWAEQQAKSQFWQNADFYGVDLTPLGHQGVVDQFAQPVIGYFDPRLLLSRDYATHTIDFGEDEPESLHKIVIPFRYTMPRVGVMHGIATWFDVSFNGENETVTLSTGPHEPGTHWYQTRLLFREPIGVNEGQAVVGSISLTANDKYSYNVTVKATLAGTSITRRHDYKLQDQYYHYMQPSVDTAYEPGR